MKALEQYAETLPDYAKDIRLNLSSVMNSDVLSVEQRWGIALACAWASQHVPLAKAAMADAKEATSEAVIDDALAAATLMAMNNVFYRFRHWMKKDAYQQKPARLRMNRIANPATNKVDFELFCLAVSAINGCEACVLSHEQAVVEGGLSDNHVQDAIRIAGTFRALAVAAMHSEVS
jgi:alkyl hydroperoxide reductase subunit D